ncbi:MAG: hypothetical protein RL189_3032, partial [Pseudomonadota bacterium]
RKAAPAAAAAAAPAPVATPTPPPRPAIVIDPAMAAAVNLLGLRLSLARNREEAAQMANERLKDFGVTLSFSSREKLKISWSDEELEIDLSQKKSEELLPQSLKPLVKKIAQCPPE